MLNDKTANCGGIVTSAKMTNIFSLPREMVLVRIFSLLPYSDLISVGRTCKHLRDSSKDDILMRRLAARIRSSWSDPDHWPAGAEVRCAAGLVTRGQLEEDVVTANIDVNVHQYSQYLETASTSVIYWLIYLKLGCLS